MPEVYICVGQMGNKERRSPQGALELIRAGGGEGFNLATALRGLRNFAGPLAIEAAAHIMKQPRRYPKRVVNIANDIQRRGV